MSPPPRPFCICPPLHNAATTPARTPTNPPSPATKPGAAFVLTADTELLAELAALDPEPALVPLIELVVALLVVDATLVVTAATVVVLVPAEVVLAGIALVVLMVEPADVVVMVMVAEDRDAEYDEQRPKPTDAAMPRSDWLQAEMRQVAAAAWREEKPVPHWQPSSLRPQPAAEMALVRQGICGVGKER